MWSFSQGYRETVLQSLPQLTALDGRNISGEPVDLAKENCSDLQCLEDILGSLVSSGCPSTRDQVPQFVCPSCKTDTFYFYIACSILMLQELLFFLIEQCSLTLGDTSHRPGAGSVSAAFKDTSARCHQLLHRACLIFWTREDPAG